MLRDVNRVYLSYSIIESEDVHYSKDVDKSKMIFDSFDIVSSENAYENILGYKNYNCSFIVSSRNCIDSAFLFDCSNCRHCFLSTNLRNKEFYIRNKPYTKDKYFFELKKLSVGSYAATEGIKKEFFERKEAALYRYANLINCVSSSGDDLINSKQARDSFSGHDLEDVRYTFRALVMKDSMDASYVGMNTLTYEAQGAGVADSTLIRFNVHGAHGGNGQDFQYTAFCGYASHLFGCIGIRNKQYCILNKQYSKEEYESLVPKIIEHMHVKPYVDRKGRSYAYGEFFPSELSPFAYNETVTQEYFSLNKPEAEENGYRWRDPEERHYKISKTARALPDRIDDVDDSILGEVIGCAHEGTCNDQCTTAFKIVPQEFQFYKKTNLPLPRLCPNCRHYQRLKQRNPLKLWHRQCMCDPSAGSGQVMKYANTSKHFHGTHRCPNEFETSYAPDRKEIVYCEQCYQAEIV